MYIDSTVLQQMLPGIVKAVGLARSLDPQDTDLDELVPKGGDSCTEREKMVLNSAYFRK